VAADEKLYKFTGNSGWIRSVPSKPSKIGHWIYEMVCTLHTGKPFLIYIRLQDSVVKLGHSVPILDVVKDWSNVIQKLGNNTILVADSYYASTTTVNYLNNMSPPVSFLLGCNSSRFSDLVEVVSTKVSRPFEWASLYRQDCQLMFTMNWYENEALSKKYCMSNIYEKRPRDRDDHITTEIPNFDLYKEIFSGCDKFNRMLHQRTWPYSTGGKGRSGSLANIRDFALSSILLNCINVFESLESECVENRSYLSYMLELSDMLYERFVVE
jgi:hypothetical protein